jgi:hypothetical protein
MFFPPLLYICVPNCQCNYITRPLGLGFEQNVIFQFVLAPLCVCVCVFEPTGGYVTRFQAL